MAVRQTTPDLLTLCPWLQVREQSWRDYAQRQAKASGEPLVTDVPEDYAGQLTVTTGGCWKWHGATFGDGRPAAAFGGNVYRQLFVALRGPFDPENHLHHECFHGWCANPWHTTPMTPSAHASLHGQLLAGLPKKKKKKKRRSARQRRTSRLRREAARAVLRVAFPAVSQRISLW